MDSSPGFLVHPPLSSLPCSDAHGCTPNPEPWTLWTPWTLHVPKRKIRRKMPSSDLDHNYRSVRPPHRSSSNLDRGPSSHLVDTVQQFQFDPTPPSPGNPTSTLPAYAYSQRVQTPPKRPSISTDLDSYAREARLTGFISDPPTEDNSPDPHDFYRPFRDPFTDRLPGQTDIVVLGKEGGMTTSTCPRKPNLASARTNGATPKYAPLHSRTGGRPSQCSGSPVSGNTSPLTAAKSSPNLSGTARNRQTSLKDLVDKFNQTPNEKPLLPAKPGARSTSSSTKAAGRGQSHVKPRPPVPPISSTVGGSTSGSKQLRDKTGNPPRAAPRRGFSNDDLDRPNHPSLRPEMAYNPNTTRWVTRVICQNHHHFDRAETSGSDYACFLLSLSVSMGRVYHIQDQAHSC